MACLFHSTHRAAKKGTNTTPGSSAPADLHPVSLPAQCLPGDCDGAGEQQRALHHLSKWCPLSTGRTLHFCLLGQCQRLLPHGTQWLSLQCYPPGPVSSCCRLLPLPSRVVTVALCTRKPTGPLHTLAIAIPLTIATVFLQR